MAKHIVIVEDDPDQRDNYQIALEQRGYRVTAYVGKQDAFVGLQQRPDLVILDIIMDNNIDAGFQLCVDLLKQHPQLPILFLTERVTEIDRILGLRMGAWDYQPKPVSLDFLAEKVATLLRLSDIRNLDGSQLTDEQNHQIGNLQLYNESRIARWCGHTIEDLTLTEFRMLEILTRRPGHIVNYDTLARSTQQHYVSNNTVSTHIRNIKRKIKKFDPAFNAIQSEYGMGYRWVMDG
jgi:two-component system OmpR family response regulator